MKTTTDPPRETWVTLAGVSFRVGARRYGGRDFTVLRTAEGKAYRMTAAKLGRDGLTYAHDALIAGCTYRVFVAPTESAEAKRLAGDPPSSGIGAPVMLEAGSGPLMSDEGERFALRRVPQLDARPVHTEAKSAVLASPELIAEIARIKTTRGVSEAAALDYVLRKGLARIATEERFALGKKSKKK